ncbi:MAG: hypothetical protein IH899_14395 [Planctomycetes bacterium]|nr:hypothetical protein [Planctomycetota bacterium]
MKVEIPIGTGIAIAGLLIALAVFATDRYEIESIGFGSGLLYVKTGHCQSKMA